MITIETKELIISDELKRKVEMICKFANISNYTFTNGNIVNFKNTNIAYVKPTYLKNVVEPIVSKEKFQKELKLEKF